MNSLAFDAYLSKKSPILRTIITSSKTRLRIDFRLIKNVKNFFKDNMMNQNMNFSSSMKNIFNNLLTLNKEQVKNKACLWLIPSSWDKAHNEDDGNVLLHFYPLYPYQSY